MTILNALTVDVEDWFHVSLFRHHIHPREWDKLDSTVVSNVCRILNLFTQYNVRATFFILGWVAERYPEIVVAIKEQGHEIASHGYAHQIVYEQTRHEFFSDVSRSIEILTKISGEAIRGYRAPSYSITRNSMWAWEKLIELGIEYDSSVFPIKHDLYGIADAPRFPFRIGVKGKGRLIEFPISTVKILGRNVPIAGGGYLRLYPFWFFKKGIEKINAEGKPAIIYFHPWEMDPHIPRINVGAVKHLRHYGNLALMEERIVQLLESFRFGPVSQVLKRCGAISRWPVVPQNYNGNHRSDGHGPYTRASLSQWEQTNFNWSAKN